MSNMIIYSSKYGSTKDYADELAKRMNWESVSYRNVTPKKLKEAKNIVLAGNVRMGKMNISGWAKGRSSILKDKCKAVISVGGTEPEKQEYYLEIVEKNMPFLALKKEQIFGCGGRQLISEMKGFDSFVFKMLDKMVKDPKEKEDIMKDKDHVNMALLDPVVEYLKKI